ncbi:ubiquitin carboxyl-terminal hydrolase 38-like [Pomacea canaliculata]|nr:ubiquitin carboxyl-terminal hydrolase 38-like [Pomacea canaliculata]XP_025084986.1 ubiquitin carboxyl-terminal hydrolase 38-like [Pomacea canaliculata]
MQYAPMRKAAFNVLSHMLLSFQHSPVLFHKILGRISNILNTLAMEGSEASLQCRTHLATLVHCLMFLHTGFPDLYDPILDLIKDVPCPSTQEIQSRLTDNRWCSQQSGGQAPVMPGDIEKSDTGKTGIFNLGNTCYMNSILQTLFMCDEFRRNVLARVPSPQEGLLSHLQQVFAFLLFSQRPAIAPMTFLAASRPSWFTPGQQQDCSEFLKFLLDEMHEQELKVMKKQVVRCGSDASLIGLAAIKSPSTNSLQQEGQGNAGFSLVKEMFGGKVRTTVMCLTCKQESHNVESFIDIPLAFPQSGTSGLASAASPMSLVGGGGQAPQSQILKQRLVIKQEESADSGQAVCLSELLNHYLSTERMEGDNKYQCDRCGQLQDGERTNTIVESPQYLILTLLRFAYDAQLQARSKVFQEVIYPRTLAIPVKKNGSPCITASSKCGEHHKTLLEYMPQNLPPGTSPDDCELYGLCSVVVHSGASSDCGHYYCYSRHSDIGDVNTVIHSLESMKGAALVQESRSRGDLEDCAKELEVDLLPDKWFMFNDNRVSHASFSSFQQISHRFTKDTPYVLVYKRLNVGYNEASSVVDPPLRADLRETVSKDNIQFLKEQEQTAKAKSARSQSSSSPFTFWEDPDSDQGPPGSCGGGGLGGFDSSGARFVF